MCRSGFKRLRKEADKQQRERLGETGRERLPVACCPLPQPMTQDVPPKKGTAELPRRRSAHESPNTLQPHPRIMPSPRRSCLCKMSPLAQDRTRNAGVSPRGDPGRLPSKNEKVTATWRAPATCWAEHAGRWASFGGFSDPSEPPPESEWQSQEFNQSPPV